MDWAELNFDGLVGPTHNYSGLSYGNLASLTHQAASSNPRAAALQGLEKMKTLMEAGFVQGVLPPQERPDLTLLRSLGLGGADESDERVLRRAAEEAPAILAASASASAMWTANAATVTPSPDSQDGRCHFTPANLSSKLHRAIEAEQTRRTLSSIFKDPDRFVVHGALPGGDAMADEGAANHTRFCRTYGEPGLHFFVYGRRALGGEPTPSFPRRFPARQTLEACEALARRHLIPEGRAVFVQQNPAAIDSGVFHNDVAAVGNGDVLFFHEAAFAEEPTCVEALQTAAKETLGQSLRLVEVPQSAVSLEEAVQSYLFNSQLLALDGSMESMLLVAPEESERSPGVKAYLDAALADDSNPIQAVRYLNLRESMRNGGGPACLRLRVVLNAEERAAINSRVILTPDLYEELVTWVNRFYRESLVPADLSDVTLLNEGREALDMLTQILGLGSVYPFQLG